MTTTLRLKASQVYKDWHVIDAADRPLGRVGTEAATLLRGKHKPTFEPHLDAGDFVIIVNAGKVRLTGRKTEQMKYHRHSGYPGGLRTRSFTEQFTRHPERVVAQCVWGMLPKGSLGEKMLKHLKVYRGPEHPHQSQVTGSERARAARDSAAAATLGQDAPPRPSRVRFTPLPGPEPIIDASAATREREARARRGPTTSLPEPLLEDATPTAAEAAAAIARTPDAMAETVSVANPPAEGTIPTEASAPRRRRRTAPADVAEPAAPRARRRSAAAAAPEAAAPPAPRTRKKAAAPRAEEPKAAKPTRARKTEPAAPEKKPARRRTPKEKE